MGEGLEWVDDIHEGDKEAHSLNHIINYSRG